MHVLFVHLYSKAHDRAGKEQDQKASQLRSLTAFITSHGSHNTCQLSTTQAAVKWKAEGRTQSTSKAQQG